MRGYLRTDGQESSLGGSDISGESRKMRIIQCEELGICCKKRIPCAEARESFPRLRIFKAAVVGTEGDSVRGK